MTIPSESVMSIQAIEQNICVYIELEKIRIRLHQELADVREQQASIGQRLTGHVPNEFIFPRNDKFYRFLMEMEDGGIEEVEQIENFESWKVSRPDTGEEDLGW